jgi:hypothetical protein
MIAFDLASLSFGTSLLQRLQQFAPELSQQVRKCCLLLSKLLLGACASRRLAEADAVPVDMLPAQD